MGERFPSQTIWGLGMEQNSEDARLRGDGGAHCFPFSSLLLLFSDIAGKFS